MIKVSPGPIQGIYPDGYNISTDPRVMEELNRSLFTIPEYQRSKDLLAQQDTFTYANPVQPNTQNTTDAAEQPIAQPQNAEEEKEYGFWGGIGRAVSAPFKTIWEEVKSVAKAVWNMGSGAFQATLGTLWSLVTLQPGEALDNLCEGAWKVVKAPFELVYDLCSDAVNGLGEVFGGIGNMISGAWDGVCDFFGGIFG